MFSQTLGSVLLHRNRNLNLASWFSLILGKSALVVNKKAVLTRG
jgi:hypothetical protein